MSYTLPPEDLPPAVITASDVSLQRQLVSSLNQRFFEACGGLLQAVIMQCEWKVYIADVLTLEVHCSETLSHRKMLNHITPIASRLAQFSRQAKVVGSSPSATEPPLEMRVDEWSVY